jgi:hypothetical protein
MQTRNAKIHPYQAAGTDRYSYVLYFPIAENLFGPRRPARVGVGWGGGAGRQPRPGGVPHSSQEASVARSVGAAHRRQQQRTAPTTRTPSCLPGGAARARAIGGGFESISLAASSRARRRRHPVRAHVTQVRPFPPLRIATYGGEATRRPWPKT